VAENVGSSNMWGSPLDSPSHTNCFLLLNIMETTFIAAAPEALRAAEMLAL